MFVLAMASIVFALWLVDAQQYFEAFGLGKVLRKIVAFVTWPISPLLELLGFASREDGALPAGPQGPPKVVPLIPAGTATCPRCTVGPALARVDGREADDELVCGLCGGVSLDEARARVLLERVGAEPASLRELAESFAGKPLTCPRCRMQTRALVVKGAPLDVCFGCGGLWLMPSARTQLERALDVSA